VAEADQSAGTKTVRWVPMHECAGKVRDRFQGLSFLSAGPGVGSDVSGGL